MGVKTPVALNLFERYLDRFEVAQPHLREKPSQNLSQVVVIPCYDEPNVFESLQSLSNCVPTQSNVEVLVVLNQSDCESAIENNAWVAAHFHKWKNELSNSWLSFHLVEARDLPKKHAGVGLARKIGMDEAVYRFQSIDKPDGLITCFDADATCSSNYLVELEKVFFLSHQSPVGASIYFEHPIEQLSDTVHQRATYEYELFLRYYVEAMRFTGHPSAFHTIGSSMAVRCDAYMKLGGMNKRKAGEDFYFLQKLIPHGYFADVTSCTVYPSPRVSHRVPFGTGKAINDYLNENRKPEGYQPEIFCALKHFQEKQALFYDSKNLECLVEGLQPLLIEFLKTLDYKNEFKRLLKQSKSKEQFTKQFYAWWDGFKVLKAVHYLRDYGFQSVNIQDVAERFAFDYLHYKGTESALDYYRFIQKQKAR